MACLVFSASLFFCARALFLEAACFSASIFFATGFFVAAVFFFGAGFFTAVFFAATFDLDFLAAAGSRTAAEVMKRRGDTRAERDANESIVDLERGTTGRAFRRIVRRMESILMGSWR